MELLAVMPLKYKVQQTFQKEASRVQMELGSREIVCVTLEMGTPIPPTP